MKRVLTFIIFLVTMISLAFQPLTSFAEDNTDSTNTLAETKMTLNYLCNSDTVILTATLRIRKGDIIFGLENASIEFTASNGSISKVLGQSKTDQEGKAVYQITAAGLPADKDGMVAYTSNYTGNVKYLEAEASISAKPAKIRLSFSIEDSIRILKVTATQENEKGETVPIPSENMIIYTPRLFSLLKIGEIDLDENGTGTLEFPKNIVGDTLGNLMVVAQIEEHDQFGFVRDQNMINWGVHKQYYQAEVPSRELWTPIAPLWMIITLIIMLVGVWAHYVYAVYELIMIKRLSKKDKPLF
ncbi:MAG: hypothetical protein Q8M08_05720 [Bacteroidales bacterium]|nr:hypothetical protein [Bacteroidales bacterium]